MNFHMPDNDVLIPRCVPPGRGHLINHLNSPSGDLFIIPFQVRKLGPCHDISAVKLLASQRQFWLSLFITLQIIAFPPFVFPLLCTVHSKDYLPY